MPNYAILIKMFPPSSQAIYFHETESGMLFTISVPSHIRMGYFLKKEGRNKNGCIIPTTVVYFDQCLGAAHPKRWSNGSNFKSS